MGLYEKVAGGAGGRVTLMYNLHDVNHFLLDAKSMHIESWEYFDNLINFVFEFQIWVGRTTWRHEDGLRVGRWGRQRAKVETVGRIGHSRIQFPSCPGMPSQGSRFWRTSSACYIFRYVIYNKHLDIQSGNWMVIKHLWTMWPFSYRTFRPVTKWWPE